MNKEKNQAIDLDINLIDLHPDNPHKIKEEEVTKLADSIDENGMQEDIDVTKTTNGRYIAVKGNTRLLAQRRRGVPTIRAVVRHFANKDDELKYLLISNERRDKSLSEHAAELSLWEAIYKRRAGKRTDLDLGAYKGDTRRLLMNKSKLGESSIGKLLSLYRERPSLLDLADRVKISVDAVSHLSTFIDDKDIDEKNETVLMTKLIEHVDNTLFDQIREGKIDITTAFQKCVRKIGALQKQKIRPESIVNRPPVNSPAVQPEKSGAEEPAEVVVTPDITPEDEKQEKPELINDGNHIAEIQANNGSEVIVVKCNNPDCIMYGKIIG